MEISNSKGRLADKIGQYLRVVAEILGLKTGWRGLSIARADSIQRPLGPARVEQT
jgi:hypothetical protein